MKKSVLAFALPALLLGILIGLWIPYCLYSDTCPTPLLPVCSHGFGDWFLRILQVVGPIAAVIVALFKEDWMDSWYKPSLDIDTSMDDLSEVLVSEGGNDVASTYSAKLRFANMGKAAANNMSIFVERVVYRKTGNSLTSEDILKDPFPLLLDRGNDSINLAKYGERSAEWLSLMKAQTSVPSKGNSKLSRLNMFIGLSFQVAPSYHSGILDVTFKIVCDNLRPQFKTVRVQWDGTWRSRKQELSNVFTYKWIENK